ncbi:MAG TPA: DUF2207 domain-containing protein [Friedmanniella sp.]
MTRPATALAVVVAAAAAGARPVRLGRLSRLLLALLLACGVVLTSALLGARPASAATGDQIDDYEISYDVRPTGVVRVVETITYRFGDTQDRHGIDRLLVTREKYDDQQDAVYTVDQIDVSTTTPGVSDAFTRTDTKSQNGRQVTTRIRIGDPDRTLTAPTATYVIAYDLTGAMRTFPNAQPAYDEFYWDATGLDWSAAIKKVGITVTVPGGVQETTCTYGPVGSTSKCGQSIAKGVATFTQDDLAAGEGVTIGNKIGAGLVSDDAPHLAPDGSKLSGGALAGVVGAAGVGVASLVGAPLVGLAYWRRKGRDLRWAGLAPGSFPAPGTEPEAVPNDPDIPIPVQFTPPRIPVAEAGLLVDGQVDTRDTAATIIDLAVRGALTVQSESKTDFRVTLVDPGRASAPHEMVLLNNLFSGAPPGTQVDLSSPGSMSSAHEDMKEAVRDQVASRGWFSSVPSGRAARGAGFGIVALLVFGAFGLSPWILLLAIPLLPILITVAVVRRKMRRGQRTPAGRAMCDQVEGFQTYLSTAEAGQLRFEEGEDIFSRYLPWAIAFDLAERWAKICADLVAMGRMPNTTPGWYYGNSSFGSFNTGFLTGSLLSAAGPVPAPASSSGTGFGGGSSFSGGGFSGGGGGGGGGGSW